MKCPECFGKGEIELPTDHDHKIPCPCCAYADALAREVIEMERHYCIKIVTIDDIINAAKKGLEVRG